MEMITMSCRRLRKSASMVNKFITQAGCGRIPARSSTLELEPSYGSERNHPAGSHDQSQNCSNHQLTRLIARFSFFQNHCEAASAEAEAYLNPACDVNLGAISGHPEAL